MVPTAITLSPSLESRAIDGSGSRSGSATGSSVSGSSTETVDGSSPAGASQSLVTSSPPSRTTNELCGRGDRQPVRGEHLELGAEPVRPAAEDQVQVAAGVRGKATGPERAARAAAASTR